ncbi:MAG: hypothetical protein QGG48_01660 [Desulfatiglandales bacterium]|nr:hypothetical protein [Desulfatiglandales bacterium]
MIFMPQGGRGGVLNRTSAMGHRQCGLYNPVGDNGLDPPGGSIDVFRAPDHGWSALSPFAGKGLKILNVGVVFHF